MNKSITMDDMVLLHQDIIASMLRVDLLLAPSKMCTPFPIESVILKQTSMSKCMFYFVEHGSGRENIE